MTTFTADAQQLFDRYLQNVRWSVRGVADSDEVERDVREHVTSAFESHDEPVSSEMLRDVLSRLGDPWQWVAPEDLPWWRRIVMRFSLGPEDWRLAYACFGLTVLGLLLMPVGIGLVFLIAAYLLGRATTELVVDRDGTLGARAWLVYPPLVLCAIAMTALILVGLAAPVVGWGIGERGFEPFLGPGDAGKVGAVLTAFGSWWLIVAAFAAIFPGAIRALLFPIANRFRRVHAAWFAAFATLLASGGVYLVTQYARQIRW